MTDHSSRPGRDGTDRVSLARVALFPALVISAFTLLMMIVAPSLQGLGGRGPSDGVAAFVLIGLPQLPMMIFLSRRRAEPGVASIVFLVVSAAILCWFALINLSWSGSQAMVPAGLSLVAATFWLWIAYAVWRERGGQ